MRHRREDKSGHYLYKRALFKVFVGKRVFKFPFTAKANQAFSAENIESLEERVINYIDEKLPRLEFRRVEVGANQINFIACGIGILRGLQVVMHPTNAPHDKTQEIIDTPMCLACGATTILPLAAMCLACGATLDEIRGEE